MKTNRYLIWLCLLLCSWSEAQVVVNVSGAETRPKPMAIVPFVQDPGVKMDFIIASDLSKTGLFSLLPPNAYSMRPQSPNQVVYGDFQRVGADYVVIGRVVERGGGAIVQVGLGDVFQQKMVGNYTLQNRSLRQSAHQISDAILEKLTGIRGSFATRLAFIRESRKGNRRVYQLMVSDIDGQERVSLYTSYRPLMSPAWSPNGRQIAYVSYEKRDPQIIVQDIFTGSRRAVTKGGGTNSSPAWSPDGRQLAFVSSVSGNPEIYVMSASGSSPRRLTNHPSIDTEPVWSPDGQWIYFTSDRSGKPQIYRMSSQGGNVERVISSSEYQAGSTLSPDGRSLVLTRQSGGFNIGLYHLDSGQFHPLTTGRLDDSASFAPNGQMIVYSTVQGGQSVLKIINTRGQIVSTLAEPHVRLRHPAWGPDTRR